MRLPPQLRITLGPSRFARAFVALFAVATATLAMFVPWPGWAIAAFDAGVGVWAAFRWRWFGPHPQASRVTELVLSADRLIVARDAQGRLRSGFVCDATYVSPSLTSVVWKPDGAWRTRSVLILPDMLPADDFRRLRVLLRYGRSEDPAGAPASHA